MKQMPYSLCYGSGPGCLLFPKVSERISKFSLVTVIQRLLSVDIKIKFMFPSDPVRVQV